MQHHSLENIKIGSAENKEAATGCTVILCEQGMAAWLDVRGGGPASRETELLKPTAAAESIHAVLLSGGSAFGLDAAGGVMEYLEERNIGFDVGITKVPLVCESCLFDLMVGDHRVRPDNAMGYAACENAEKGNYRDGNFGAGTGATVGKFYGPEFCMKSGIGSYAVLIGDLQVGAIVAVIALGDIYDWKNGKKGAGLLAKDKLMTNPCTAHSDELLCNGCSTCENVCPYGAITYEDKEVNDHGIREVRRIAVVNNALCQGCGACTVACPSGAMDLQGFSNRQIIAEVDAICQ